MIEILTQRTVLLVVGALLLTNTVTYVVTSRVIESPCEKFYKVIPDKPSKFKPILGDEKDYSKW